ncbi:hypothetical protein HHI_04387 [Hyphomonas hirschiana VP5]|uniref:DUF805 domain-containing protein n=1 Tax=Hyphomonas hirschiana VP5 TaxID=1280951 RepID=A0A059FZU5_9PROT|nr:MULTISPECIES: DUF805 domain-containing protein [Hyphomonas]KCZ95982.1 hypothetical protein HHI_04387 [Hyphomonas hirschiana VP5]
MDFRHVFFDPKGRIGPRTFGQGYVLLTGAMLVVTVLSLIASPGAGILQYALVFPYICLFGKRLHDAGLSAWLWLVFLLGYFLINVVASAILVPILAPETQAIQLEVQKVMEANGLNAGMEELARRAPEIAQSSALVNVIVLLIASAIVGFVAYRLRSDPQPNRHGPPTLRGNRPDARP